MNRRIKKKLHKRLAQRWKKSWIGVHKPRYLMRFWMCELERYHVMDIKPNDTTWTHAMRQRRYHIKGVPSFRYQQIGGYDIKPPSIVSFIPEKCDYEPIIIKDGDKP